MSLAFLYTEAFAALPQGIWTFERSLDYFGRTPANQAPRFTRIVVRDKTVSLSDTCLVSFSPDLYLFSDVFQPLTKQGITDKQVDNFLMQNFKLSLLKTTEVYSLTSSSQNCADQVMEFFVVDDRLLIPMGGTFFSYVKTGNGAATGTTADSFYSGYKQSRLPMDFERYYASCKPKIMSAKGRPQTSDKCAPDFFPYVADNASLRLNVEIWSSDGKLRTVPVALPKYETPEISKLQLIPTAEQRSCLDVPIKTDRFPALQL
jgi:hypothetical protein